MPVAEREALRGGEREDGGWVRDREKEKERKMRENGDMRRKEILYLPKQYCFCP